MRSYGYLTVEYICVKCGWSVKIKTKSPKHHALSYYQAIEPKSCFKCQQKRNLEMCDCDPCTRIKNE